MERLQQEIIKTLLYFEVFSFPLSKEEIARFCSLKVSGDDLDAALAKLLEEGSIHRYGHYFLVGKQKKWVEEREEKHAISTRLMEKARRNAQIISQFPFVRGVAISGSLSKWSADDKADIDFFIITRSGRLWICRSMLHFFKKLTYLVGLQHQFCMNYFLDEDELELKDKNIFTAIESITVIPLYGTLPHRTFFDRNAWLNDFLPNAYPEIHLNGEINNRRSGFKRMTEGLFPGKWGDAINRFFLRLTIWWWRKKFKARGYPMEFFAQDFRSTTGESKNHPNDYQRRILRAYAKKLKDLGMRVG
ncbi:MAG TPA: hypothetical protein PKE06_07760 [Flavilitoribacter sp.]|nr:hypothetical protein [Flavilitoribacter sp.]HMQ88303.1 hypothetical protein [Flavilitoribacter sp.]